MDKTVKRQIGQRLRSLGQPDLAGVGLMDQLRTTAFVLLGLTAAAGLGIVAIFSQQSWQVLTPSPLPAVPGVPVAIGDAAIAAGPAGAAANGGSGDAGVDAAQTGTPFVVIVPTASPPLAPDESGTDIAIQRPVRQVPPPDPGGSQTPAPSEPGSAPTQAPVEAPVTTPLEAPVPAPAAPVNPPVLSTPDPPVDPVPGKGHGYGHFKSHCDGSPPAPAPAPEPAPQPEPDETQAEEPQPDEPEPVAEAAQPELPEEPDI